MHKTGRASVRSRAVPDIGWVAALALALTLLWLWRTDQVTTDTPFFALPWDRHKYIEIALHGPLDFHIAPYCWRIGTPLLAAALPFGLQTSFLTIAVASVWLGGVFSWLLARAAGFSRALALAGMLFFYSLQWGAKFFLFDFWLPDATICMLVILAVLLLLRGRLAAFIVVATLGVTVKESMLFVLPLVYTFSATRLIDLPAARRTLLAGLPALLMFIGIRLAIPAWNSDPSYIATLPERLWLVRNGSAEYVLRDVIREEARNRIARFGVNDIKSYSLRTFGPALTLLPLLAWRRNLIWFVRFLPFLLLVAAQMLFGHDIERYLILAFPAVLIMALTALSALSERFSVPEFAWTLAPALLIVFELARTEPFFLELRYHALALAIALLATAALTVVRAQRRGIAG